MRSPPPPAFPVVGMVDEDGTNDSESCILPLLERLDMRDAAPSMIEVLNLLTVANILEPSTAVCAVRYGGCPRQTIWYPVVQWRGENRSTAGEDLSDGRLHRGAAI